MKSSTPKPLVVALDGLKTIKNYSDDDNNNTELVINNSARLALKKLLYESMTPNEYTEKGFSREQINFFDYLGDIL